MYAVIFTAVATIIVATGGAMVLNHNTLVPMAVYVAGILFAWRLAWKLATQLSDILHELRNGALRMQEIERRLTNLEKNL